MTSPISNSDELFGSSSFERLDPKIQKWIWREGWAELKDAQEQAIPVILNQRKDVIIAAATASGKTEAAFLPILTQLLSTETPGVVLYISPLKALINDQWGRLTRLCEELNIPVTPWHGDISDGPKKKFLKNPKGVVLITPESLEALLMNRGSGVGTILQKLQYCVLDEAHAFIGSERGKQVQTLLSRIDDLLGRKVVRVGLSATLGEMSLAAEFLRPGAADNVEIISSKDATNGLKVLVRGYVSTPMAVEQVMAAANARDEVPTPAETKLVTDLFAATRGTHNLIFPNSRRDVERFTDQLNRMAIAEGGAREYWPHHGSLARDLREDTESALKNHTTPATGVCTTTLELGIDIGDVESVSQVGAPPSVASLRQRLGRSGRRHGKPSILRCYCLENELSARSSISEQLRERLIENVAIIELLARSWYEPPRIQGMHLSTLIQQLLSLVGQFGGIAASDAWHALVGSGVFPNVTKAEFIELLKHLGERKILMQESSGLLLHGELGEKLANHYGFFASFSSDDEYRLVCEHKALGTLPIERPVAKGSYLLFGGRRWLVLNVNQEKKLIDVQAAAGGKAPFFSGSGWFKRHDKIRETMRGVLHSNRSVDYLDETAAELLQEARKSYRRLGLDSARLVSTGDALCLFSWKGDWIADTIVLMLASQGITAHNSGLHIDVRDASKARLIEALSAVLASPPSPESLAALAQEKAKEKWDTLLPPALLDKNYASHHLDVPGALEFIEDFKARG